MLSVFHRRLIVHERQPGKRRGACGRPGTSSPGAPPSGGAPWPLTHCGVVVGQCTPDPDTKLWLRSPHTCPLIRPGLRAMFRSIAIRLPSTSALQQPVPPPPPVKAICSPVPITLYSTLLFSTFGLTWILPWILKDPVTTKTISADLSAGPSRVMSWLLPTLTSVTQITFRPETPWITWLPVSFATLSGPHVSVPFGFCAVAGAFTCAANSHAAISSLRSASGAGGVKICPSTRALEQPAHVAPWSSLTSSVTKFPPDIESLPPGPMQISPWI